MATASPNRKPWLDDTVESVEYLTITAYLRVDEHLIGDLIEGLCDVIRLSHRNFRVGLGIFAKRNGVVDNTSRTLDVPRCQLSRIVEERLVKQYEYPIEDLILEFFEGQLAPKRSFYVRDVFSIIYMRASYSGFLGLSVDPQHTVALRLRTSMFLGDNQAIVKFVQACAEVLASDHEVFYGFVDLAPAGEIAGGRGYTSHAQEWMTWHRSMEHSEWVLSRHCDRMKRVRGVYWGNFLGSDLAKRLDPDGTFAARFAEHAPLPKQTVRPQRVIRYESGAMFITLSDEPLNLLEDGFLCASSELGNAVWLKRELREKGLV